MNNTDIEEIQNMIPLPSGCDNCWGDLHQGCTDACKKSSDEYHKKRGRIKEIMVTYGNKRYEEAINTAYFQLEKKARDGVYGVEVNELLDTLQALSKNT